MQIIIVVILFNDLPDKELNECFEFTNDRNLTVSTHQL